MSHATSSSRAIHGITNTTNVITEPRPSANVSPTSPTAVHNGANGLLRLPASFTRAWPKRFPALRGSPGRAKPGFEGSYDRGGIVGGLRVVQGCFPAVEGDPHHQGIL